jgi:selenocysteine lyase/cysteine desulfurase
MSFVDFKMKPKPSPTPSSATTIPNYSTTPEKQWPKYATHTPLYDLVLILLQLLNAPSETLVFMPNATTGVNTVLRNLTFQPGDHILYFATIYGACEKTVAYITETTSAQSIKITYTYPIEDDWLINEFHTKVKSIERAGGKVKIAIFDTIVSMPGVRMPFERLTQACKDLGVLSCIDGAHGVGHIHLDLSTLDPDFFVSNCHKYIFPPTPAVTMN